MVREDGVARHREDAVTAFNRAWELIETEGRTRAQDREMLSAAFASRYLWDLAAGGDQEYAVGDWQIAHVAALLGLAELSLRFAGAALATAEENGWSDWRLASMLEGMARACAAAGDAAGRDRHAALAREVLATVDDAHDRELIAGQLDSIPGVGRAGGDAGGAR
jgi:hypothetical protein